MGLDIAGKEADVSRELLLHRLGTIILRLESKKG